jgi:hypothetical protein
MIGRWLANIGLGLLLGVAWIVGVVVLATGGGTIASPLSVMFGVLYGLVEWAVFGLIPVLLYLVIGEFLWARLRRPRLASILLGAIIVGAYPFAVQAGHIALTIEAILWLLAFLGVGATFGAIARLPSPSASPDIRER